MHLYLVDHWRAKGWSLDEAGRVVAVVCHRGALEQTVPTNPALGQKIRTELLSGVEVSVVIENDWVTIARVKRRKEAQPGLHNLFNRFREPR